MFKGACQIGRIISRVGLVIGKNGTNGIVEVAT
jgi:hypothetical protein